MNPKLTSDRLSRRAIVYIRQSSPGQVTHNRQRRQYCLADRDVSVYIAQRNGGVRNLCHVA
jgi:DNA invertase Pin-like site-specific DNA recombinase